jgi:hypothetical protein
LDDAPLIGASQKENFVSSGVLNGTSQNINGSSSHELVDV